MSADGMNVLMHDGEFNIHFRDAQGRPWEVHADWL